MIPQARLDRENGADAKNVETFGEAHNASKHGSALQSCSPLSDLFGLFLERLGRLRPGPLRMLLPRTRGDQTNLSSPVVLFMLASELLEIRT